jgi:1-deoxy-D-xylulose-5-phosphate synthase
MRYPKAAAETVDGARTPIELGRAEVIDWGHDGMIVVCGTLLANCIKAAAMLREEGLDVGVVNARFVKPLDAETLLRAIATSPFVVTVEEAALMGGFGSSLLEAASDAGHSTAHVRRLGIPDRFIEHAERGEQLADLGLDAAGIALACRQMAARRDVKTADRRRVS